MRWEIGALLWCGAVVACFVACVTPVAGQRWLQSNQSIPANWTTDYATPPSPDSPQYDRCKTTHRCNRATGSYDVDLGQYLFRTQRFAKGREENADLFINFEDWRAGTVGWGVDYVRTHEKRYLPTDFVI